MGVRKRTDRPVEAQLTISALELADLLRRASFDGGQASRATVEAQCETIKAQGLELTRLYGVVSGYEAVTRANLKEYGTLAASTVESNESDNRRKLLALKEQNEAEFKLEVLKQLGPEAKPAIKAMMLKLGLGDGISESKMLSGAAPGGQGLASLLRIVKVISASSALPQIILEAGPDGPADLLAATEYLEALMASGGAVTVIEKTNGAAN